MCLSLAQLRVDICFVLFHLPGQGQRQPDVSCGHRIADTFLGRQEGVVSDSPGGTSDLVLWTVLSFFVRVCQHGSALKIREKNTRCSSKRDSKEHTNEK